ncbi:MAG: hypothetical protein MR009_02315, partial [Sutterellaceae bacterium]|nr:hypothetical protein [Sutterellaceae bacterium]MDY2867380.1 hypothetical protein [Mesosutterella sp.]
MNWEEALARCSEACGSFYLYSESGLSRSAEALKRAFPDAGLLYSVKCNPHPLVLRAIARLGLGADAASAEEVRRALLAGISPDQIYYSAPGKTREDIAATLGRCTIAADSLSEVDRIREAAKGPVGIGLRINPDFSAGGGKGGPSKFGIDEEQALDAAARGFADGVTVAGLHVHLKSQEPDERKIAASWERTLAMAARFFQALGGLRFVNLGSGLPLPATGGMPAGIGFLSDAFRKLSERFHTACPGTRILLESGRLLAGGSGVYATKVVDRKVSRGKTFIILDSTVYLNLLNLPPAQIRNLFVLRPVSQARFRISQAPNGNFISNSAFFS